MNAGIRGSGRRAYAAPPAAAMRESAMTLPATFFSNAVAFAVDRKPRRISASGAACVTSISGIIRPYVRLIAFEHQASGLASSLLKEASAQLNLHGAAAISGSSP